MKTVVLIFSIILSLLGILVGQFVYPFMASLFDGPPILFAGIIGVLIVIVLSIIVSVATKEKFYRASIKVPCAISVIATFFILFARFSGSCYYNGYCFWNDGLKNNIGVTIVDSPIGLFWYMGLDEYGNEVLVNIDHSRDQGYYITWYDESGNYLGYKKNPNYSGIPCNLYQAKDIIEGCVDIELYKPIGN